MVAPIYHRLPITEEQLAEFCRKHHIERMSVFGSVLRDDFGPQSDVDFLVEFEEGFHPGWNIIDVERELSELIGGRGRCGQSKVPKSLDSQARFAKCRVCLCQRLNCVISATCSISHGERSRFRPG